MFFIFRSYSKYFSIGFSNLIEIIFLCKSCRYKSIGVSKKVVIEKFYYNAERLLCGVLQSGYQQRKNKQRSIPENYPVFWLPFKKPDLLNRWVKFCNRKDWTLSKNGGICAKHFEKNYLKMGI